MRSVLVALLALGAGAALPAAVESQGIPPCHEFVSGGLTLRWDHCYADGGTANRVFACNGNTGTEVLIASLVAGAEIPNVNGLKVYLDLASSSGAFPSWWLGAGSSPCRFGGLTASTTPDPGAAQCQDVWPAGTSGGLALRAGYDGPDTRSLFTVFAVPAGSEFTIPAGVEVLACRIFISHSKTVGTGACAGCETPMCIALSEVEAFQPNVPCTQVLKGPAYGADSHLATWQGAAVASANTHWIPGEYLHWYTTDMVCTASTPVRRALWGTIKSLYR